MNCQCGQGKSWREIAWLFGRAVAYALTTFPVLIKFDGLRENGKIYTVGIDAFPDYEATRRFDGADLSLILREVFPTDPASAPGQDEPSIVRLADLLAMIDRVARSGCYIAIRIDAAASGGPFEIVMGDGIFQKQGVRYQGADLVALLEASVSHYNAL
ncbi:hypothetical protein [Luteibacter aegosomatissinici]|uniref:hypothetical protein n=1 Tax=Luteibacter aegosomatissinici TaxID=2911539 RepID=UPI001FF9154E|nr:hypothetical protein [Luteibacter aegosomatissinici]UPG93762.1 hypothetical protein L2Y97_18265 [Luteibacter aegosomatissinici]